MFSIVFKNSYADFSYNDAREGQSSFSLSPLLFFYTNTLKERISELTAFDQRMSNFTFNKHIEKSCYLVYNNEDNSATAAIVNFEDFCSIV